MVWPGEIARRKGILEVLASQPPQPALNTPPEVITEPFTIMLWGIASDAVERWVASDDEGATLKGMAGSPGVVEAQRKHAVLVAPVG